MGEPANVLNCWRCGKGGKACPRTRGQRVLVVDDDAVSRGALKPMLEQDGYCVEEARNGLDAVQLFERRAPDIILMDVQMPVMDGYRAAAVIREMAQTANLFCPILFLSEECDEYALARCIECGGDDFLVKPYSHNLLRAKLQALGRISTLYAVVQRQHNELSLHHRRLRCEHEIAERTLSMIMESGSLESDSIRHRIAPMGISSGDMILSALRPDGTQQVLLGDFTGHGLSAAIGAMPVSDAFLSMTRKGFDVSVIAAEINCKLKSKTPAELFLAACLLEVDPRRAEVRCWNGGIPDVLVFRPGRGVVARAVSQHLPLGITGDFDASTEVVPLIPGDCILVHSDGVTEAVNADGDMFGETRLHALIDEHRASERVFDVLWSGVETFRQGCDQNDDISLVEVRFDPLDSCETAAVSSDECDSRDHTQRLEFEFDAALLRSLDPQQLIADCLRCLKPLRSRRTEIYTVVTELFCNALDHGLLQLDSALKRNGDGFGDYYRERLQRLGALEHGWIRVAIEFTGTVERGELRIRVSDSGNGFDHQAAQSTVPPQDGFFRRGLSLVQGLCESLIHLGAGNIVEAVYLWEGD